MDSWTVAKLHLEKLEIGFQFHCTTDSDKQLVVVSWQFMTFWVIIYWRSLNSCYPSSRRSDQHPVLVSRGRPLDWQRGTCRLIQGMTISHQCQETTNLQQNNLQHKIIISTTSWDFHTFHAPLPGSVCITGWSLLGMIRYDGVKAFWVG